MILAVQSCAQNAGGIAVGVLAVGVLTFALTAFGTWWNRLVGRRLLGRTDQRLKELDATKPATAQRIRSRMRWLGVGIRLTQATWDHLWLTSLVAALAAMALFGGLFVIFVATSPNSCG